METFQDLTHSQECMANAKWEGARSPEWNWLSRKRIRLNTKLGSAGDPGFQRKALPFKVLVTRGQAG